MCRGNTTDNLSNNIPTEIFVAATATLSSALASSSTPTRRRMKPRTTMMNATASSCYSTESSCQFDDVFDDDDNSSLESCSSSSHNMSNIGRWELSSSSLGGGANHEGCNAITPPGLPRRQKTLVEGDAPLPAILSCVDSDINNTSTNKKIVDVRPPGMPQRQRTLIVESSHDDGILLVAPAASHSPDAPSKRWEDPPSDLFRSLNVVSPPKRPQRKRTSLIVDDNDDDEEVDFLFGSSSKWEMTKTNKTGTASLYPSHLLSPDAGCKSPIRPSRKSLIDDDDCDDDDEEEGTQEEQEQERSKDSFLVTNLIAPTRTTTPTTTTTTTSSKKMKTKTSAHAAANLAATSTTTGAAQPHSRLYAPDLFAMSPVRLPSNLTRNPLVRAGKTAAARTTTTMVSPSSKSPVPLPSFCKERSNPSSIFSSSASSLSPKLPTRQVTRNMVLPPESCHSMATTETSTTTSGPSDASFLNNKDTSSSQPNANDNTNIDKERRQREENHQMIEIAPNHYERLRGARETLACAETGSFLTTACLACSKQLCCIDDADYVLCPECRVVSPIFDADRIHHHKKVESTSSYGGGGVGLGFTVEDLQQQQHFNTVRHPRRCTRAITTL